jgi:hypothetical protein
LWFQINMRFVVEPFAYIDPFIIPCINFVHSLCLSEVPAFGEMLTWEPSFTQWKRNSYEI